MNFTAVAREAGLPWARDTLLEERGRSIYGFSLANAQVFFEFGLLLRVIFL